MNEIDVETLQKNQTVYGRALVFMAEYICKMHGAENRFVSIHIPDNEEASLEK